MLSTSSCYYLSSVPPQHTSLLGLHGQPRPAVNAFGNPIVPPGTIRAQQMPFIPPPQSSSSAHPSQGSSTGRSQQSTMHGQATGPPLSLCQVVSLSLFIILLLSNPYLTPSLNPTILISLHLSSYPTQPLT